MERPQDEPNNMSVEKDKSCSTIVPDSMGCQNLSHRAEVRVDHNMIVSQPGRTTTTEKNEEESLVINWAT